MDVSDRLPSASCTQVARHTYKRWRRRSGSSRCSRRETRMSGIEIVTERLGMARKMLDLKTEDALGDWTLIEVRGVDRILRLADENRDGSELRVARERVGGAHVGRRKSRHDPAAGNGRIESLGLVGG